MFHWQRVDRHLVWTSVEALVGANNVPPQRTDIATASCQLSVDKIRERALHGGETFLGQVYIHMLLNDAAHCPAAEVIEA